MTNEIIEENKKKYLELFDKFILPNYVGAENLRIWIVEKSDFFTAPASTKYNLAEEGGLCAHTLNVFNRLMSTFKKEYMSIEPDAEIEDVTAFCDALCVDYCGIALVSLCFSLYKCNTYKKYIKNEKIYSDIGSKHDALGRYDWIEKSAYTWEPDFYYGRGAKSVFILQCFLHDVSIDEAMAIRYHLYGNENMSICGIDANIYDVAYANKLVALLHIADLQAQYIDEIPAQCSTS